MNPVKRLFYWFYPMLSPEGKEEILRLEELLSEVALSLESVLDIMERRERL